MSSSKKKYKGISRDQLQRIWRQISINDWLTLLQEYLPQNDFKIAAHNTLQGRCPSPDHADNNPSFWLHSGPDEDDKCFGSCYGCNFFTANPVELVSIIKGVGLNEALQYLQEKYSLSFLPKKAAAELEARKINQDVKNAIYQAAHFTLVDAISNPQAHPYANQAVDWLINTRKFDKGSLSSLPVGIMPPLGVLQQLLTKQHKQRASSWKIKPIGSKPMDVTDAVTDYLEATYNSSTYNGSLMWPLHTNPREIGRIKLRVPITGSGPKQIAFPEDDFESQLGLFGLGWDMYSSFFHNGKIPYMYVVEGELDAMSVMDHFMRSSSVKFPIVSAGGTSESAHIENILRNSGVQKAFLVGDSPGTQGDIVVQGWLEHFNKLPAKVFTGWDLLHPSTDVDEAINHPQVGMAKVEETLWKKSADTFVPPWNWAFERARIELDGMDPEDHRALIEKATSHGRYLNHRLEESAYVNAISKAYTQIPEHILKLEITTRENNSLGFIYRIREALASMFKVIGTEVKKEGNGRVLVLFNTKTQKFLRVILDSEKSIAGELAPSGGMLIEFIEDHVGFPSFLEHPNDTEGSNLRKVFLELRFYIKEAFNSFTRGALDLTYADRRNQGFHWVDVQGNASLQYLIVGNHAIRFDGGDPTTPSTPVILEAPIDNDIILGPLDHAKISNWLPEKPTVASLQGASKEELLKVHNDLVDLYRCAFMTHNHELTSRILAASLMMMPIMDAVPRPPLIYITGDTQSGKSSLVSTFRMLKDKKGVEILNHSIGYTGLYTAAGVLQGSYGDSRLCILDEFELDGGNRKEIRKLFETYRSMINGDVLRITGTPAGLATSVSIRHPIILAAISTAEKPQDINRWLMVYTVKVANREASEVSIRRKFSKLQLTHMRKIINMGIFAHAQELRKAYTTVQEGFDAMADTLPYQVERRHAENLFPAAAMHEFLGLDWKEFFTTYSQTNEHNLKNMDAASESETRMHMLLRSNMFTEQETRRAYTLQQLLNNTEKRAFINQSECGTYYDAQQDLLVFLLQQVVDTLVSPTTRREHQLTPLRLRESLKRHTAALSPTEIIKSGVISRAEKVLGRGMTVADVSVLRVSRWTGLGLNLISVDETPDDVVELEPTEEKEEEVVDVSADDYTNNCDW